MKKLDFICFSVNNWEKRKARKQQFMLHLALRQDVGQVLYVEPALNLWRIFLFPFSELRVRANRRRWMRAINFKIECSPESEKLFIFTPIFFIPFSFRFQSIYNLNLYISFLTIKFKIDRLGFKNTILWLYHPFDYYLLRWFKNRMVSCFDWAEDWAEYFMEFSLKRRRYISDLEKKVIKETDIVFVVSQVLLERAKRINDNSYQILDGTMPEIFAKYDGRIPAEMKNIPHPIVGYVGTVFKRVDLDLIRQLSEGLPQYSIVLVGNILYPHKKIIKIRQKNNVFLLGGKSYDELPNYMMNFDVCILPYIYELSLTISPTKIYDYLATGKPIVSTALPEIDKFKDYIKIAHSREEFLDCIKEVLREDPPDLKTARMHKAEENSWANRCNEIMALMQEKMPTY